MLDHRGLNLLRLGVFFLSLLGLLWLREKAREELLVPLLWQIRSELSSLLGLLGNLALLLEQHQHPALGS